MPKELNNPTPDSKEEQSEKGTELEEGKKEEKKEEVALPEKFKGSKNPLKDVLKAYNVLEDDLRRRGIESGQREERLAKLEGIVETQKKAEVKLPEITKEQRGAMIDRFKDDFIKDPLMAMQNFNAPLYEDIRLSRDRADKLEKELGDYRGKQKKREMRELAAQARGTGETAKKFDELMPKIQEELKNNKAWEGFDNPPEAVFYHLLGKSTKNLARVDDADVESHVEGSSDVIPDGDKKKEYVGKILKARTDSRL